MHNQEQAKPSLKIFLIVYLVIVLLLLQRMPPISDISWMLNNDDAMRLVQVRDFMAGQGWFDLTQYRLGLEGGSSMHWSRLIDLPIAALIWIFAIFLPIASAETATMIVWPLALAGVVLWVMQRAIVSFGGKSAEIFGVIFMVLAISVSKKFEPGSLDHHNVQLVMVAVTLMAMMSANRGMKVGVIAGLSSAFGLTIGLEVLLFVATVSLFVALKWVWVGKPAQRETTGFSLAFGVGLLMAMLIIQPDFSGSAFRCDALGFDLVLPAVIGALGLSMIARISGDAPFIWRVLWVLVLGVVVLLSARFFAPACLSNPFDPLYPDVARQWLGRISEAQTLLHSVKSDGKNFGLLFVPLVVVIYTIILARDKTKTAQAVMLGMVIAAAYAMTLYQIRGLYFMLMLCALPISAILGMLYARYKISESLRAGVFVIVVLLISIPDMWSAVYLSIKRLTQPPTQMTNTVDLNNKGRLSGCFSPDATKVLAGLPAGMVIAGTDLGAGFMNVTPHRVLGANFHRGQDGILAGLQFAWADLTAAEGMLREWRADYVVFCQNDWLPMRISYNNPPGIWPHLYHNDIPGFLSRISENPDDMLQVFAFTQKEEQ
ncbi:MAG: hypothetical protein V3V13_14160 [Paracoccaceae bacterium]